MPGLVQDSQFKHIIIKEIGKTFAAEVEVIDFSQDILQDVFDELLQAITKVSPYVQPEYELVLTASGSIVS